MVINAHLEDFQFAYTYRCVCIRWRYNYSSTSLTRMSSPVVSSYCLCVHRTRGRTLIQGRAKICTQWLWRVFDPLHIPQLLFSLAVWAQIIVLIKIQLSLVFTRYLNLCSLFEPRGNFTFLHVFFRRFLHPRWYPQRAGYPPVDRVRQFGNVLEYPHQAFEVGSPIE